jgi:uncharacterized membrane protein YadS
MRASPGADLPPVFTGCASAWFFWAMAEHGERATQRGFGALIGVTRQDVARLIEAGRAYDSRFGA